MESLSISDHGNELQREYGDLLKTLSMLITQRDVMINDEEPFLTALYLREIGGLQYEALVLKMDVKALLLKQSLLQKYINEDRTPDLEAVSRQVEDFFIEAEKVIHTQKEYLNFWEEYLQNVRFLSEEETKELRHLYQTLVKVLHPDLNPNQTDEEKALLLEVIKAYKTSDLDKLRAIYLEMNPDTLLGNGIAGLRMELEKEIKRLQGKVEELNAQIDKLNGMFPFIHRDHLKDEVWIEEEKRKNRAAIDELKKEKERLTEIVSLMEEYESQGL